MIQTGQYIISSKGTFYTFGAVYKPTFIAFTPYTNLDKGNYGGCGGLQFKLAMMLSANDKFILVVTSQEPGMKGNFSIIASGPNNVNFTRVSKYLHSLLVINQCSYTVNLTMTETRIFFLKDTSQIVQSIYASQLIPTSKTYIHAKSYAPNYYEAVQMKVIEAGKYIICSSSNINSYGSIYNGSFIPYNPNENLLAEDDNDCDLYKQFKLNTDLHANSMYTLVMTTFEPYVTGNFSIIVSGPDYVIFNRISKHRSYSVIMRLFFTK